MPEMLTNEDLKKSPQQFEKALKGRIAESLGGKLSEGEEQFVTGMIADMLQMGSYNNASTIRDFIEKAASEKKLPIERFIAKLENDSKKQNDKQHATTANETATIVSLKQILPKFKELFAAFDKLITQQKNNETLDTGHGNVENPVKSSISPSGFVMGTANAIPKTTSQPAQSAER